MVPALLLVAPLNPVRAFDDYLKKPDPAYAWTAGEMTGGSRAIEMTSQKWQGIDWKHQILYRQPDQAVAKGTAILYITGDGPRPGDLVDLNLITASARVPVAMLFDVPNQPLWDMKEDDLIAHTFQKYLETGDPTWPLLLPMTKSALRAMDTIQAFTKGSDNPIQNFVVVGASKRGWTTWLVGASGDRRVSAIAPLVYDNLNLAAQMPHQLKAWGKYSEMIEDYTKRGLQGQLGTEKGRFLGALVDPFTYRDRIKAPTLVVKGSNDPYWTEDALSLYWPQLKEPRTLLTVPNAGHTLGTRLQAVETIGAFARAAATKSAFPKADATFAIDNGTLTARITSDRDGIRFGKGGDPVVRSAKLWVAQGDTTDFRQATWRPFGESLRQTIGTPPFSGNAAGAAENRNPWDKKDLQAKVDPSSRTAAFVEVRYVGVDGREFSVSSPTVVF